MSTPPLPDQTGHTAPDRSALSLRPAPRTHDIFPVRLHVSAAQDARFMRWWATAQMVDRCAWLAVQSVLQRPHTQPCIEPAELRRYLRPGASRPHWLRDPAPGARLLTPKLKNRLALRLGTPGSRLTRDRLCSLVAETLRLPDRQASSLLKPGARLPEGLLEGAVRRHWGPLMHVAGFPDEVVSACLAKPGHDFSGPVIHLHDLRPVKCRRDGAGQDFSGELDGCTLMAGLAGDGSVRLNAELFTLPARWRRGLESDLSEGNPAVRPIRRGVLQRIDGGWQLWLVLDGLRPGAGPSGPVPVRPLIGLDPGQLRPLTACTGWPGVAAAALTSPLGASRAPDLSFLNALPGTVPHGVDVFAEDIRSREVRFRQYGDVLDRLHQVLSPFRRIVCEGGGMPGAGEPVDEAFLRYRYFTFLPVVLARLAADAWPGYGRREVLLSSRVGSSTLCPSCLLRAWENAISPADGTGMLTEAVRGSRTLVCPVCRRQTDRDVIGAESAYLQGARTAIPLPHLWTDLPGELETDLGSGLYDAGRPPGDVLTWEDGAGPPPYRREQGRTERRPGRGRG